MDAANLPDLVLLRVLELLPADDVVSVGQVCRRWRRVAVREEVWRLRELDAAFDDDAHGRRLARVLRFAPCLAGLSVGTTSWSSPGHAARAAVKQDLLHTGCKVGRLTDVWCHVDPGWAGSLLAVHAEHVREVEAAHVDGAVLKALHTLARHRALVGLRVWHCDAALRVHDVEFPDDEEGPQKVHDGEGGPRGLQWLDIFDLPQATTLSLLRAHRHSLREVTLHVGTAAPPPRRWGPPWWRLGHDDGRWPDTCSNLHLQLAECGLKALEWLQLDRYGRAHPLPECASQLAELRKVLPGVTVLCRQCDDEGKRADCEQE